jgi:hypothetical protein
MESVYKSKPDPRAERNMLHQEASNLRLSYAAVIRDLQEERVAIPPPVQEGLYRAEHLIRKLETQQYVDTMKKRIDPGQASPL